MLRLVAPSGTPIHLKHIFEGLRYAKGKMVFHRFQDLVQQYFNSSYCFSVSSGRSALTLILKTFAELKPEKREVIIPGYTCFSVPSAVVKVGLKVVLADIAIDHLGIDIQKLEGLINEHTLAIVTVHLLGIPNNTGELAALAKRYHIPLIDDAAQAMGATWNGRKLGTFGDIGIFSLGRGKNITTGDGGLILTDSEPLASRLEEQLANLPVAITKDEISTLIKLVGISCLLSPHRYWFASKIPFLELGKSVFSTEFKIGNNSQLAAGIGLSLLPELAQINTTRRENAEWLQDKVMKLNDTRIRTIIPAAESEPVYLRFPMLITEPQLRQQLYTLMVHAGIGASLLYPSTIAKIPGIDQYLGNSRYSIPVAEEVADSILTLPTHPYVTQRDLKTMDKILKQARGIR